MTKIIVREKEYLTNFKLCFQQLFQSKSLPSTKFGCVGNETGKLSKGFKYCVLKVPMPTFAVVPCLFCYSSFVFYTFLHESLSPCLALNASGLHPPPPPPPPHPPRERFDVRVQTVEFHILTTLVSQYLQTLRYSLKSNLQISVSEFRWTFEVCALHYFPTCSFNFV